MRERDGLVGAVRDSMRPMPQETQRGGRSAYAGLSFAECQVVGTLGQTGAIVGVGVGGGFEQRHGAFSPRLLVLG